MTRDNNSHREGDRQWHRDAEGPAAGKPPGEDRYLSAVQGRQWGGANDAGFDGRRKPAARGAEQAAEAGRG